MAEQILINEGREAILALRNGGLKLSFAVWYSDPLTQNTYLALGAQQFDVDGPSRSYEMISSTLKSLQNNFIAFKVDFIKLVPLTSELGVLFSNSFSNKSSDTIIGIFATTNYIFHQVYAYGSLADST